MLIPRFTLRWLLVLTTVSGLFFLVVSLAIQGQSWAIAVATAVGSVGLTLLVHAALFLGAWVLATLLGFTRGKKLPTSPFARSQLPPQWVQPVEPE